MTHVVRPATLADLPALHRMAQATGGGFTNLPPDEATLTGKLTRAGAAFARQDDTHEDDLYLFVLEDAVTGEVRGTCQIMARIGCRWPFYSYRIGALTQVSAQLGRAFRAETLTLCTDLDGASEVGGLFLDPAARAGGLGRLLARSRYLFIERHRARFAARTIAELRGMHDAAGSSPFWDGLAGRFFGLPFAEADAFNAIHGNQFIADLMPRQPIYVAMLTDAARAAIGRPHHSGAPAMRMLEGEGFAFDCYVDIFDGGPTMIAETDAIATLRRARTLPLGARAEVPEGMPALVSAGRLGAFRCGEVRLACHGDAVSLAAADADALGLAIGDPVTFVAE